MPTKKHKPRIAQLGHVYQIKRIATCFDVVTVAAINMTEARKAAADMPLADDALSKNMSVKFEVKRKQ